MQLTALACPNCGAPLDGERDGQYLCSYCGHRSVPPRPVLDQAKQDELLAAAIARHDAARMERARAAAEQASRKEQQAEQREQRNEGRFALAFGGLFVVLAGIVLATAAQQWRASGYASWKEHGGVLWLIGPFFGIFGAAFMVTGMRSRSAQRRKDALRARGTRGRAVIESCCEARVIGFDLVLRVELIGRPPYTVKMKDTPDGGVVVAPGLELPVFVDPDQPQSVIIDWLTAGAM